jgi:hypothetical protein
MKRIEVPRLSSPKPHKMGIQNGLQVPRRVPARTLTVDEDLRTTRPVQNGWPQETMRQRSLAVEAIFSDIGGYLTDRAES